MSMPQIYCTIFSMTLCPYPCENATIKGKNHSMKFNIHSKQSTQSSFAIEPVSPEGYYKYKSRFINLEQRIIFSGFLKNAYTWFYLFFSFSILVVMHYYLYTQTLPHLMKGVPVFFQSSILSNSLSVNLLFAFFICIFIGSFMLALYIYNQHKPIARFIITLNMIGDILFLIGIIKMLETFTQ